MKVAVCFATGYEEVEALSTVDVMRRGKVDTIMVGVDGKTVVSSRNISINMDATIEEVNWEDVDMVVLPGGLPGVDNLIANENLCMIIREFKEKGKFIGAICAAPSILGKLGVLEGEKATCYPGFEQFLAGATVTHERVTKSNRIITGIGAGASLEFAFVLLEQVRGKEVADEIRTGMIMN